MLELIKGFVKNRAWSGDVRYQMSVFQDTIIIKWCLTLTQCSNFIEECEIQLFITILWKEYNQTIKKRGLLKHPAAFDEVNLFSTLSHENW